MISFCQAFTLAVILSWWASKLACHLLMAASYFG
jgi:hypothetical protein